MLGKIIPSFILFTGTRLIFAGIDSTGFKITHASEYYISRAKLKRKNYAKLSIGVDVSKTDNMLSRLQEHLHDMTT